MLCEGCVETVWMVWGDCLDGLGRMSGGYGINVSLSWRDCLDSVWRWSGGYIEAVWRVRED